MDNDEKLSFKYLSAHETPEMNFALGAIASVEKFH